MAKKEKTIPLGLQQSYRESGMLGTSEQIKTQEDRFFESHKPRTAHEEACTEMMAINYLLMMQAVRTSASLRTGDPVKDFELSIKSERYISSIQRAYMRSAKGLLDAQKQRHNEERADALLEAQLETEAEAQAHHDQIAAEMKENAAKRGKVLDVIIHDAPHLTDDQMLQNAVNAYYVRLMEDLGFVPHKYKNGPIDIKPN